VSGRFQGTEKFSKIHEDGAAACSLQVARQKPVSSQIATIGALAALLGPSAAQHNPRCEDFGQQTDHDHGPDDPLVEHGWLSASLRRNSLGRRKTEAAPTWHRFTLPCLAANGPQVRNSSAPLSGKPQKSRLRTDGNFPGHRSFLNEDRFGCPTCLSSRSQSLCSWPCCFLDYPMFCRREPVRRRRLDPSSTCSLHV
jgi:hypothetical protein